MCCSKPFSGWIYREFGKGLIATGQVKNSLENFPPKTPEMVGPAKAELRAVGGRHVPCRLTIASIFL